MSEERKKLSFEIHRTPQDFLQEVETRFGRPLTVFGVLGINDLSVWPIIAYSKGEINQDQLEKARKFEEDVFRIVFDRAPAEIQARFLRESESENFEEGLEKIWQGTLQNHLKMEGRV